MIKTILRTVRGNTIEFDQDLGIAEGQEVQVQVTTISEAHWKPGEGLLRTEGALADDTEWDAIMGEIYQARKLDRRPDAPDLVER